MATKKELQAQADALGIMYTSRTTGEELQSMIDAANGDAPAPEFSAEKKGKFNAELIATLKQHAHINNVWVSDEGNWHFREAPGFKSYSREEILNG